MSNNTVTSSRARAVRAQRNIFGCGRMGWHRIICLFLATPFAIQIHFHPLATNRLLSSAGRSVDPHSFAICVLDHLIILHKTKQRYSARGRALPAALEVAGRETQLRDRYTVDGARKATACKTEPALQLYWDDDCDGDDVGG